jgi:hypothetical protein
MIDPRTPVIVGVAQSNEREADCEPIAAMTEVVAAALARVTPLRYQSSGGNRAAFTPGCQQGSGNRSPDRIGRRALLSRCCPACGLTGAVHVGTVLDPNDADSVLVCDDPIDDSVRAAACRVVTGEVTLQGFAHTLGLGAQQADHELDDGRRDTFRQPAE